MNDAQLEALRTLIENTAALTDLVAAQDYPGIAEHLNASTVIENPEPQGTVLAPITLTQILGMLTPAEKRAVLKKDAKAFTDLTVVYETADSPELDRLMGWLADNQRLDGQSIAEVAGMLVDAGRRDLLADMVTVLVAAGRLSVATAQTLGAAMAVTTPDPDWRETVAGPSLASAAGLPAVRPSDVQAVLA